MQACVVSKSGIRIYDEGRHRFFFFDIMDDSATIRVKTFNLPCDRIYPNVIVGSVLVILLTSSVYLLSILVD